MNKAMQITDVLEACIIDHGFHPTTWIYHDEIVDPPAPIGIAQYMEGDEMVDILNDVVKEVNVDEDDVEPKN